MDHKLKIMGPFFEAVLCGDKTFEIRFNDRGYQKGDQAVLREWIELPIGGGRYTGREINLEITYVSTFQQKEGFVVLGSREVCEQ